MTRAERRRIDHDGEQGDSSADAEDTTSADEPAGASTEEPAKAPPADRTGEDHGWVPM